MGQIASCTAWNDDPVSRQTNTDISSPQIACANVGTLVNTTPIVLDVVTWDSSQVELSMDQLSVTVKENAFDSPPADPHYISFVQSDSGTDLSSLAYEEFDCIVIKFKMSSADYDYLSTDNHPGTPLVDELQYAVAKHLDHTAGHDRIRERAHLLHGVRHRHLVHRLFGSGPSRSCDADRSDPGLHDHLLGYRGVLRRQHSVACPSSHDFEVAVHPRPRSSPYLSRGLFFARLVADVCRARRRRSVVSLPNFSP